MKSAVDLATADAATLSTIESTNNRESFMFQVCHRWAVVFVVVLCWTREAPAAAPQQQAEHLVILLAMDTDGENIGAGVERDYINVAKVIAEIRSGREGKIELFGISGKDCTPQNVLDFYRARQFERPTSLLFYYSGHGGLDTRRGHFLAMARGNLFREDLRQAMEGTGAILQVILSDACSNIAGLDPPNRRVPADWDSFKQLFFCTKGMVDIIAAEEKTFSWGSPSEGGMFTQAFTRLLCEPVTTCDANSDGTVTWAELYTRLYYDTNAIFVKARDESGKGEKIRQFADQKPRAYYLQNTERHKAPLEQVSTTVARLRIQALSIQNDGTRAVRNIIGRSTAEGAATTLDRCSREMEGLTTQAGQAVKLARRAKIIMTAQQGSSAARQAEAVVQELRSLESTLRGQASQHRYDAQRVRLIGLRYP
jgi:hypothetical protein